MMPEKEGFQVVDEMRADEELRGIPVVVYTAKDLDKPTRDRLTSQVQQVIEKGAMSSSELLARLESILPAYAK